MSADSSDHAASDGPRDSRRHQEMIFHGAREMMLLAKVEADVLLRVVSVNRAYLETVRAGGYPLGAADLEGRSFAELMERFGFDAGTVAGIRGRFEEVIRTRRPAEFEEITPTRTGRHHGRSAITPILGEAGECAYVLYSSQDVTAWKRAEAERAESERRLRAILDHSIEFIGLLDPAGRLLRPNQTSLDAVGAQREEVEGKFFWETPWWTHAPAEQERLRAAVARAAQGEFVRFETSHPAADGRLLNIDFSLQPVRDETGRVVMLIPEGRDITEHRAAERALRDSEEKFASAFRLSPDIMSISDFETGCYLEVNEAHERVFGYPRGELLDKSAFEFCADDDPAARARLLARLREEGRIHDHEVQVRARDGRRLHLLLSAEIIRIGGRKCVLRVSRDMTAARQAEAALRESEEKFAKAFLSSPHPLTITELATGRYIDVNLGFERVTGYRREEVIGRTSLEVGIWEDLADRAALFERLTRDGQVRGLELQFRKKDGGRVISRCAFECIELAGRRCMLSTIEDITEQRRTEEQKAALEAQLRQNQKLEALGTLAGGIAHDFNNILTAIIVNQELALMDLGEPADLRRRLAEIGQASNRAKELVRQILTFSRQQPQERLRQRMQMIIREALGLVRASLPANIEIAQDLSPDAPAVLADGSQIHQVVMNLCTNAAHAMRERPGRLTVRLAPCELDGAARPGLRPGKYAQLTVADTGHGMEAAVLARIFEPFFTTKAPGEGTGLGLPMVHGIMKDHEGAIFVQSLPGAGTTFDLYFPAAATAADDGPAPTPAILPGRGEAVLVVDDEDAIGQAVGDTLRRIGYRAEVYADPREALECMRARGAEFSLLLTDRTMPHLSGPELIRRVHTWRPDLPVLLMSGLGSAAPPDEAAEPAGCGIVEKPIDIAELSRTVRHTLDAARLS